MFLTNEMIITIGVVAGAIVIGLIVLSFFWSSYSFKKGLVKRKKELTKLRKLKKYNLQAIKAMLEESIGVADTYKGLPRKAKKYIKKYLEYWVQYVPEYIFYFQQVNKSPKRKLFIYVKDNDQKIVFKWNPKKKVKDLIKLTNKFEQLSNLLTLLDTMIDHVELKSKDKVPLVLVKNEVFLTYELKK